MESETETKGDRGTESGRDTHIEKQREQGGHRHRNRKRQVYRVQAAGGVWSPVGGQALPTSRPRVTDLTFPLGLWSARRTAGWSLLRLTLPARGLGWGQDRQERGKLGAPQGGGEACGSELGTPPGAVGAWPARLAPPREMSS